MPPPHIDFTKYPPIYSILYEQTIYRTVFYLNSSSTVLTTMINSNMPILYIIHLFTYSLIDCCNTHRNIGSRRVWYERNRGYRIYPLDSIYSP